MAGERLSKFKRTAGVRVVRRDMVRRPERVNWGKWQMPFEQAKIRNIRWNRLVDIEIAERHAISREMMDPPLQ